jgi:hypothetical protein
MLFATFTNVVGQGNVQAATNASALSLGVSQTAVNVGINSADISNAIPVIGSAIFVL